jgi:hypothetical protein
MSLNLRRTINDANKQARIAEGEAVLASIFSSVAVAA